MTSFNVVCVCVTVIVIALAVAWAFKREASPEVTIALRSLAIMHATINSVMGFKLATEDPFSRRVFEASVGRSMIEQGQALATHAQQTPLWSGAPAIEPASLEADGPTTPLDPAAFTTVGP